MHHQFPFEAHDKTSAKDWALLNHPLVGELPVEALGCLQEHGRSVFPAMGEVLIDAPMVRFVVSGAFGIFSAPGSSCVGFVGPGGLHGLDRCFAPPTHEHLITLLDAEIIEVPAEQFASATGRIWTERMFGHQATGRLRSMAAEAACGTRHTVAQRMARWLLRLSAASAPRRKISITQSMLAEALGVQRTTANAALCALQERGIISTIRGSIAILAHNDLRHMACGCDQAPGRSVDHRASPERRPAESGPSFLHHRTPEQATRTVEPTL